MMTVSTTWSQARAPDIVVLSGAVKNGAAPFSRELARFTAFDAASKSGVSIAVAHIDGATTGDNIIVGSGPGVASEVRVFSSRLPALGTSPAVFSSFSPYPGNKSGVTLSSGFIDFTTGRQSIVTAPGPGAQSNVKVFVFPLLAPLEGATAAHQHGAAGSAQPVTTTEFKPFGATGAAYRLPRAGLPALWAAPSASSSANSTAAR
jgi:hypothetical protein